MKSSKIKAIPKLIFALIVALGLGLVICITALHLGIEIYNVWKALLGSYKARPLWLRVIIFLLFLVFQMGIWLLVKVVKDDYRDKVKKIVNP